jgi:DNA-binding NarL/FixJ family response regulator
MSDEPMSPAGRIRVVVVDDHPALRDGIRAGLDRSDMATVVGEASDGKDAVELVRKATPDVVLMDLQLPILGGVEAIRQIAANAPQVKILVLTVSANEADVVEAVRAGACGYLLKTATTEEIVDGIRRAHQGDAVFTPVLAGMVLADFRRMVATEHGEPLLTARENEILRLIAQGHSYGEIGEQLFISPKTVRNHVQNILRKLQLGKRYELMRYAIERGLDRSP